MDGVTLLATEPSILVRTVAPSRSYWPAANARLSLDKAQQKAAKLAAVLTRDSRDLLMLTPETTTVRTPRLRDVDMLGTSSRAIFG